eukprot:3758902-Pyramimonas_sp.AAC.1
MLAAFIVDPSLGQRYMQVSWAINWQEDMIRSDEWLTEKQLYDHYGQSEGKEMINDDLVKARPFFVSLCCCQCRGRIAQSASRC